MGSYQALPAGGQALVSQDKTLLNQGRTGIPVPGSSYERKPCIPDVQNFGNGIFLMGSPTHDSKHSIGQPYGSKHSIFQHLWRRLKKSQHTRLENIQRNAECRALK